VHLYTIRDRRSTVDGALALSERLDDCDCDDKIALLACHVINVIEISYDNPFCKVMEGILYGKVRKPAARIVYGLSP
jgi:hypothetical protein